MREANKHRGLRLSVLRHLAVGENLHFNAMGNTVRVICLSVVLSLGLVACAAPYNTNFPLIEKRMTMEKVTQLLGNPRSAESGPGETKIYYYRLASSILDTDGSDTREYWVQTQDGTVIGNVERTDAVTMLRQAQQFEAAWRAARMNIETLRTLTPPTGPAATVPAPTSVNTTCTKVFNSVNCTTR